MPPQIQNLWLLPVAVVPTHPRKSNIACKSGLSDVKDDLIPGRKALNAMFEEHN